MFYKKTTVAQNQYLVSGLREVTNEVLQLHDIPYKALIFSESLQRQRQF
jgi:hypothetical protein